MLTATLTPNTWREARLGNTPEILTDIYNPDCNLAVWKRTLSQDVALYLQCFAKTQQSVAIRTLFTCQPAMADNVRHCLQQALPKGQGQDAIIEDVVHLMEMYECLFEPQAIGMRLTKLDRAMCPRFHVDYLPARLVTCYLGAGTQWLPEPPAGVTRIPTEEPETFEQLHAGDVALLKGDGWYENEGFGIVHRSPPVPEGQTRLFLSLDWAD